MQEFMQTAKVTMLVSGIYAIIVLDLKLVKREKVEETPDAAHVPATS